jgi:UDP-N-acetylmuramate dehydrogenase
VGVKSGGCYFKTPSEAFSENSKSKGVSAGALIDSCGLKGLSYGSAAISEIHGNFLINTAEKGSSEDVLKLAQIVKDTVYSKTGIALSEEVVYVPNPKKKFFS